jgi:uncharacterized protein YndB with AHSA1/START domain
MDVKQNSHIIEVDRIFDTSVETLYRVWTDAEHLMKWWHPMGKTLINVKNELHEGGDVTYYIGDEGLEVTGKYNEVIPNERLVYSWIWNMNDEGSSDGYILHLEFSSESENKSRLKVLQEGFSAQEFLKPHQDGWDKGLDDLSDYLRKLG